MICATVTSERARELALAPMVQQNTESQRTAFLVTVDYRHGTTTGISAADRAATIRALVDPTTRPDDLLRPGHIFPLEAREGGVLKRAGHTEAAIDLARLAGCAPVGVLCEIVSEGQPRHGPAARARGVLRPARPPDDLDRRPHPLPPAHREARAARRHRAVADDVGRVRVRRLRVGARRQPPPRLRARRRRWRPTTPLVRVHSECLTGDVFGSGFCQCGRTLDAAMRRIVDEGAGVLVYLRGHEGRGLGVAHTLAGAGAVDPAIDPAPSPTAASTASAPRSSPTSASPGCA